jgi:hypothetical protein
VPLHPTITYGAIKRFGALVAVKLFGRLSFRLYIYIYIYIY